MKAHDRLLPDWFQELKRGSITLPRFQRFESWDSKRVEGLLNTVLDGLPAGAALILNVDTAEQFPSRPLAGTPATGHRVTEQLLDGQQRLTALWRSFHDDYPNRRFFVGFEEDPPDSKQWTKAFVWGQSTYQKGTNTHPLWVTNPAECVAKGIFPLRLLRPGDIGTEINDWLNAGIPLEPLTIEKVQARQVLTDTINSLRSKVATYNIPFLALPATTAKDVALDVFVKMNTSSVKLSTYDIVVALVEDAAGESLHALADKLTVEVPSAQSYAPRSDLILDITALRQDRAPGKTGYAGLDYKAIASDWPKLIEGARFMVEFLEQHHIFDAARLPSYVPLPVIAALHEHLPTQADALGVCRGILRRYLWSSFLTNRYDRGTTARSLQDYRTLKQAFAQPALVNKVAALDTAQHPVATEGEILTAGWPKKNGVLDRGLIALQLHCGAWDIADTTPASRASVQNREYHHLFPDARLSAAGLQAYEIYRAVNCALITWRTNRTISAKDPLTYLKDRLDNAGLTTQQIEQRLRTHLIPFAEFNVGGYDQLSDEDSTAAIRRDYTGFCRARARILATAARLACAGEQFTMDMVFAQSTSENGNESSTL